MEINMTTFAGRKEHYIGQTLQSLFSSTGADTGLSVNLLMGSEDESHVQKYAAHPAVRIISWDMETSPDLRWNCTLNKIRALRYGDAETALVCEDDIVFKRDWLSVLSAATAAMGDEEYIMTLLETDAVPGPARAVRGTLLVKKYPAWILQGSQALFYPTKALRDRVADYLHKNLTKACGDELIGRYARAHSDLYATSEPLVEHVGVVSCFH